MPESRKPPARTAAWNTLGIFITRLISLPLGLLSSVVLAWALGDALRGAYGFLLLFNSLWLPIASFGLGGSVIYFISSKRYAPREVLFSALGLGCLQGLAVVLVVLPLWHLNWLGKIAPEVPPVLMAATLAALPLQGLYLMGTRVLAADSWFSLQNKLTLVGIAVPVALQLLLLIILPRALAESWPTMGEWPLYAACAIYVSVNVLLALTLSAILIRWYRPEWRWNVPFLRASAHYGFRVWWGDITTRLNLRGDQLIMSYFVTKSQFGLYAIAVTISEMLWNVPDSMNYVLFNKIAAESQPAARAAITERIHRILLAAMVALAVLVGIASPWLIGFLYPPEFLPAVEPLWWLLPGTVFLTTTKVMTKYFGGSGKPELSSIITISGTVIGLTACWTVFRFAPQWGIAGAAAASSLGYFVTAVMSIAMYRREVRPRRPHLFLHEPGDARWCFAQLRGIRGRATPPAAVGASAEAGPTQVEAGV